MRASFALLSMLFALFSVGAAAQALRIEIIPVQNQAAEELLSVLRPLVPKPGSINAYQGRLVINSTDSNILELRAILAELDRPRRNLLITIHHGTRLDRQLDRAKAFGTQRIGDATISAGQTRSGQQSGVTIIRDSGDKEPDRLGINVLSTRSRGDERDHQQIRVLEGHSAFISAGEDVPVANRSLVFGGQGALVQDSIEYKSAASGFYVRARLTGGTTAGRVYIDVSTERTRRLKTNGGVFSTSSAFTTLTVPLGEWIELGGNIERAERNDHRNLRSTRSGESVNRQIFIKVEVAD